MIQTRQIAIQNRVLTYADLQRIARIFSRQQELSQKSNRRWQASFEVGFSDGTSIEGDNQNVLDQQLMTGPARPVEVRFSYCDYSLNRRIAFSVSHGEGSYGNTALVRGEEASWVSENFLALKEAIESARPQSFWFRRHPTLLLNMIALGIGCLAVTSIKAFLSLTPLSRITWTPNPQSAWVGALRAAWPALYAGLWAGRWFVGLTWGAYGVRDWLLSLWPNIELDLGAPHLRAEEAQRRRLIAVFTLVVIPILISFATDFLR